MRRLSGGDKKDTAGDSDRDRNKTRSRSKQSEDPRFPNKSIFEAPEDLNDDADKDNEI